jgi:hypothetical protein
VLRKPSLLTNLAPSEQRALLVCVLTVLESIDGALVTKLWEGREDRARALFELLELALDLFQVSRLFFIIKLDKKEELQAVVHHRPVDSKEGSLCYLPGPGPAFQLKDSTCNFKVGPFNNPHHDSGFASVENELDLSNKRVPFWTTCEAN